MLPLFCPSRFYLSLKYNQNYYHKTSSINLTLQASSLTLGMDHDEPNFLNLADDDSESTQDSPTTQIKPVEASRKPAKSTRKKPLSHRDQLINYLKSTSNWTDDDIAKCELTSWHWRALGSVMLLSSLCEDFANIRSPLDISNAFCHVFPSCKCVVAYVGKIKGELRRPNVQIFTPNGNTYTVHTENGIKFAVRVYVVCHLIFADLCWAKCVA